MIQKSLVLLKPDAVERALVGTIISRFENVGLKLVAAKLVSVTPDFAKKHYDEHVSKPFYHGLEKYITSGPVFAMVLEGINAIEVVRKMVGSTEPHKAQPGTIRGDFAHVNYAWADNKNISVKNLIHASDSEENATKETYLWFNELDIIDYSGVHEKHTRE
jgi:nucleoside-diphosphate kinase